MCRATPNYNINFMAKQTKKNSRERDFNRDKLRTFFGSFALERRRFLSNLTYFRAGIIINELNIFQLSPERGGRFCNNALSWGAVGSRLTWNFHQPRLEVVFFFLLIWARQESGGDFDLLIYYHTSIKPVRRWELSWSICGVQNDQCSDCMAEFGYIAD